MRSKISKLKVEKVVSPPKKPTVTKNLKLLGITQILFIEIPKTKPINKHPIILTKKVPNITKFSTP